MLEFLPLIVVYFFAGGFLASKAFQADEPVMALLLLVAWPIMGPLLIIYDWFIAR